VAADPPRFCSTATGCITCADEGVEVRVVAPGADGLAECVDPAGVRGVVDTALVGAVAPGDALLVHAAVALARLEREVTNPWA
jgi:hydrogenase maturation factor